MSVKKIQSITNIFFAINYVLLCERIFLHCHEKRDFNVCFFFFFVISSMHTHGKMATDPLIESVQERPIPPNPSVE